MNRRGEVLGVCCAVSSPSLQPSPSSSVFSLPPPSSRVPAPLPSTRANRTRSERNMSVRTVPGMNKLRSPGQMRTASSLRLPLYYLFAYLCDITRENEAAFECVRIGGNMID